MKIKAQKINMTQVWKSDIVVPITILKSEDDNLSSLKEGELVNVTGRSKGRGFQGVVKRHGFSGGPKTHGQKDRLRAPGSIGATAPQRVIKGKKMAGHMGASKVSIKNLKVEIVKPEEKLIYLKGAVPGARGSRVIISKP